MILTEKDLKYIITESVKRIISEAQVKIDNFDKVAKLMDFGSDDDFYFVQIIKRYKDNPHADKSKGNYNDGAWYLNSWRIRSVDELMKLKPEIIKIAEANNARAYVTINPRSEKQTNQHVIKMRMENPKGSKNHEHAEDIVPAQAKPHGRHTKNWVGQRLRFFIDIDPPSHIARVPSKKQWLFDSVKKIIKALNMDIIEEYETPSGGLHLVLPNREHPNFPYLLEYLRKFDNWKDKGKRATAHTNIDGKIILYSNVQTKGY
jgi:hypothetical protein